MFAHFIRNGVHRGQWMFSTSKVFRAAPVISTQVYTLPSIRSIHFNKMASEHIPMPLEEFEGNVLQTAPPTLHLEPNVSTFEEAIALLKVVIEYSYYM